MKVRNNNCFENTLFESPGYTPGFFIDCQLSLP